MQKRISKRIAEPNKHGKRDIKSSAKKAIEARQRHPLTSSRRIKDMTDTANDPSKIYLNDKLAAVIDQLYYEKYQVYPDAEFRIQAILSLRDYARNIHIQMENDGFINVQWNELDDDIKMYYALTLEDVAKENGWDIYRCVKQWVARNLIGERIRSKNKDKKKKKVI